MASFIFAINAVLPIILMVVTGYFIKKVGLIDHKTAGAINKIVFRVLLPCMLFLNVYSIENINDIESGYIIFSAGVAIVFFFVTIPLSFLVTKDARQRGPIVQASFRSNYALIGIPLATSLFGDEGAIVATVLSAFIIPVFNVLAVVSLSIFSDKEKINFKKILLGIIKNPLIISIALGFLMLGIRAIFVKSGISFRLTDIAPLYSTLSKLSAASTPIALLVLGAQFEFSAIPALKKQILLATLLRVLIVPTVALIVAYVIGGFRGAHFAAFVAVFATPVAVSSVPMAQEMGADTELAGQLVVWTTVISAFTIFLYTVILKSIGVFV